MSLTDYDTIWRSKKLANAYTRMTGVKELFEAVKRQGDDRPAIAQQPWCVGIRVRDPNGYVLVFSEIEAGT